MKTPVLILNFKTYPSGTGDRALNLARIAEGVSKKENVSISLAVQLADLCMISRAVSVPVLSQHLDPVMFGSHTGHTLPEAVKACGAKGSLINHSERRIGTENVRLCIRRCRQAGLLSVVCVDSLDEAREIMEEGPDFIAFEDPELIGTLQSVSQKKPENVRAFSSLLAGSRIKPLCGAGVASGHDIKAALELGTEGVLLASVVMRAKNPEKALLDLAQGLK